MSKRLSASVVAGMLLLLSCSADSVGSMDPSREQSGDQSGDAEQSPAEDGAEAEERTAVVAAPTSVLVNGESASDVSISMSQQFFESSPGAVVADEEAQLEAASLGAAYSVPVLVDGEGLAEELDRLGVEWVIQIDLDLELEGIEIVRAVSVEADGATAGEDEDPAEAEKSEADAETSEADQETSAGSADESEGGLTDEVPAREADPSITVVDPQGEDLEALLALEEGEAFTASEQSDVELDHDIDLLERIVVLTDGSSLAAVGTARAAGATIIESPSDPRGSSAAIEEASTADFTMGVFEGELEDFEWQLATAATGVELPGGTQHVFGSKRYIALYGSPVTPSLGLLGEQDVPGTVARAEEMAEPYRELTDDTIVPAQEIIVTVAAGDPGDDGNYSHEGAIDWFIPLIEAAGEADQYVILDFQPGRTDFLTQIQQYEELLAYPHVGIALDPEWRLGPDEVPLTRIGHVEIDEVNEVVDYLADYVRDNDLPQKMIILHQFQLQMIRDRDQLDLSRSEVALLIHADGQGSQPAKNDTWQALHRDAPDGVAWGWKNFIDEDLPMLTPEQTFAVEPMPEFVSYQ